MLPTPWDWSSWPSPRPGRHSVRFRRQRWTDRQNRLRRTLGLQHGVDTFGSSSARTVVKNRGPGFMCCGSELQDPGFRPGLEHSAPRPPLPSPICTEGRAVWGQRGHPQKGRKQREGAGEGTGWLERGSGPRFCWDLGMGCLRSVGVTLGSGGTAASRRGS